MKRDRLETLLHVRELVEKRRLAERATAERERNAADAARNAAVAARAALRPAVGTAVVPDELIVDRLVAMALQDAVITAGMGVENAQRSVDIAERRRTLAAIERRSVERLKERRDAEADRDAARLEGRRLDEAGLNVWRRKRA